MILNKDQFPITIQAYEMAENKEFFIAEQVVNNQSDVDAFVSRYAGKVIKARALTSAETTSAINTPHTKKPSSSSGYLWLIILIILILLVVAGFYTGWIQRTFGINL